VEVSNCQSTSALSWPCSAMNSSAAGYPRSRTRHVQGGDGRADNFRIRFDLFNFRNLYLAGAVLYYLPANFLSARAPLRCPPTFKLSNYLLAVPGKTKAITLTLDYAVPYESPKGSLVVASQFGDLRVMQCFGHEPIMSFCF
jgi:hypothetical protein